MRSSLNIILSSLEHHTEQVEHREQLKYHTEQLEHPTEQFEHAEQLKYHTEQLGTSYGAG